ncbi:hypothetical protein ATG_02720 [Desulfurococcaceae archaeon AG1]|jgi:hypothetical protein|nr:MAG: hypothetical protein DJ555_06065 [Desulfurococcaceae archaeon]GAY25069.1 hypothetical protein ATG_02720 [Desulfurococcaceae archaeon AG1]
MALTKTNNGGKRIDYRGYMEKCVEAEVVISGKMAIVMVSGNKRAVVPLRILCDLAKRFNICYKNYKC